jgi:hypothetical protein
MTRTVCSGALALLFSAALFAPAHAQTQWLDIEPQRSVVRAEWGGGTSGDGNGGAAGFLSGRFALRSERSLVIELPVAESSRPAYTFVALNEFGEPEYRPASRFALGSPYLGLSQDIRARRLRLELGLRAPLADTNRDAALHITASTSGSFLPGSR